MLTIPIDDIEWVEAAGNYVQIHTARKTHLVRHTVKAMERKLDPQRFVRVRPSAIVCAQRVEALARRPGGDYVVVLRDGTRIPSSRSFRARIEQILGKPPRR
jgi:two-component system, LytTR family, response regulator